MRKLLICCAACLMGISAMAQIEPKRTSEDIDAVHFVQNETSDWYKLANEPTVSVGTTITIDGISYNLYEGDVRTTFGKAPDQPTGLEPKVESQKSANATKFLHNGQLFIRKDGKTYNAVGAEL